MKEPSDQEVLNAIRTENKRLKEQLEYANKAFSVLVAAGYIDGQQVSDAYSLVKPNRDKP